MASITSPPRYAVQILLPEPAVLDPSVVHRQLLGWRADVERIGGQADEHFGFAIPTQDLPLLAHVFPAMAGQHYAVGWRRGIEGNLFARHVPRHFDHDIVRLHTNVALVAR